MLIKKGVVKAYCRLGNETLAAKEAGYKKFSFPCESGISAKKETFCRNLRGLSINQAQSAQSYFHGDSNEFTELRHRKRFFWIIKRFLHN